MFVFLVSLLINLNPFRLLMGVLSFMSFECWPASTTEESFFLDVPAEFPGTLKTAGGMSSNKIFEQDSLSRNAEHLP